jgi:hypothetical protein
MTVAIDELLVLEKRFWTGDSAFFEQNTDSECLVALSLEMAGVMGNKDLAGTVKDGNRWKALEFDLKGTVQPSDDVVMLTYGANATRANGETYDALVSTGYVRRSDGWKMMFHQQTPLG